MRMKHLCLYQQIDDALTGFMMIVILRHNISMILCYSAEQIMMRLTITIRRLLRLMLLVMANAYANIIKVGSRNINATKTVTMYERTHDSYDAPTTEDHQKLSSSSVTLILEPNGVVGGVVTVKVTDDTVATDAPTKSPPITFTLYSVKYQSNITGNDNVTTLVGDGVEYAFDNDVRPLGTYFTFLGRQRCQSIIQLRAQGLSLIREVYSDTPRSPTSVKTVSKTLSTSSSAPVFIDMKRGTNKVTASVSGGTPKTVIFIYTGSTPAKYPEIEITGVNDQIGAIQARLEEPLTVKVTDGNNRPLSGLAVQLRTTTGSDSMFIPVPGTRVYGSGAILTQTQPPVSLIILLRRRPLNPINQRRGQSYSSRLIETVWHKLTTSSVMLQELTKSLRLCKVSKGFLLPKCLMLRQYQGVEVQV